LTFNVTGSPSLSGWALLVAGLTLLLRAGFAEFGTYILFVWHCFLNPLGKGLDQKERLDKVLYFSSVVERDMLTWSKPCSSIKAKPRCTIRPGRVSFAVETQCLTSALLISVFYVLPTRTNGSYGSILVAAQVSQLPVVQPIKDADELLQAGTLKQWTRTSLSPNSTPFTFWIYVNRCLNSLEKGSNEKVGRTFSCYVKMPVLSIFLNGNPVSIRREVLALLR
jgi:hypothetical protein